MIEVAFRELLDSAKDIRDKQTVRHPFYMSASVPVPNRAGGNPGMAKAIVIADQDADILITGINGSIVAPSDAAGRRQAAAASVFPFGLNNVGAAIAGFAGDGLQMNIYAGTDQGDQLSDPQDRAQAAGDPVALLKARDFLQPGYWPGQFAKPVPFRRYLRRGGKLVFQFYNNDTTAGGLFHYVSLVLSCRKYAPFTK